MAHLPGAQPAAAYVVLFTHAYLYGRTTRQLDRANLPIDGTNAVHVPLQAFIALAGVRTGGQAFAVATHAIERHDMRALAALKAAVADELTWYTMSDAQAMRLYQEFALSAPLPHAES